MINVVKFKDIRKLLIKKRKRQLLNIAEVIFVMLSKSTLDTVITHQSRLLCFCHMQTQTLQQIVGDAGLRYF